MTDANKEPQAAPGEILQEPTPEREPQQQTPARQLIEGYKDILNREMLETQGKRLEDMTAGEFIDAYQDMTPEEKDQIAAQTAEMLASFAEANREALDGITAATKGILSFMAGETNPIADALARAAQKIGQALKAAREAREEFIKSEEWPKLQAIFPDINEYQGTFIAFMAGDLIEYGPEITEILEEYEAEEGRPLTFEELLERPAPDDPSPDDPGGSVLLEAILYRAQRIREERRSKLPKITAIKPVKASWPVDKINGSIWNLLELGIKPDTNGQLTFAMESKKDKRKKKELNLIYSINFSDLEGEGVKVSKRLTPTDKRVYIAIAALYNAGNEKVTLSQIHEAMGNTRRPSKNQIDRINESVYKMARAWITVNDAAENKAYSYDIDEHRPDGKGWTGGRYEGPLLPIERGQIIINGQLALTAIHIFREPPMLTFARLKNQITAVELKLLQSPVSKTDGNLLIEDYLLTRIAKGKNSKRSEKILLKTLYENTGITDKKQRQRARGKIEAYLKYYEEEGFITSYTMEADSVTVYV